MERHTKSYLQLVKPGIVTSNVLTAVAGFFVAKSNHGFVVENFLGVVIGIAFVIASACVVNNILDRNIDVRMKRTKGREIASGSISISHAAVFAIALGTVGFGALAAWTNIIVFALGVIAYLWYIVVYAIAKRTTPLSTIIGAVCGALPPVAGYATVTGVIDTTGIILFVLLMIWQLPHFYAISVFRKSDYEQANLPVWSVKYGAKSTKAQIYFWVVIFTLIAPLLTLFGATGYVYLVVMSIVNTYWLYQGAAYYNIDDDIKWARRMFGVSLIVLLTLCAMIAVGGYLP